MAQTSGLVDGDVKVTFLFVEVSPKLLTLQTIREITKYAFNQEGIPHNDVYTDYIMLAEDDGTAPDSGKSFTWNYEFPGRTVRVHKDAIMDVTAQRRDHELNAKPGQVSTRPKRKFLTSKTLVIVAGSAGYLGRNVRFYLEEEALSREAVFQAMQDFLDFKSNSWKKDMTKNRFVRVRPSEIKDYKFYADYFNALLDYVLPKDDDAEERGDRVYSTDELLSRLG
jgi:hypothetical protein